MYKLQLLDELILRIASYGTSDVAVDSSLSSLSRKSNVHEEENDLLIANKNYEDKMKKSILEMAILGPGFFAEVNHQSFELAQDKVNNSNWESGDETVEISQNKDCGKDNKRFLESYSLFNRYARTFSTIAVEDAIIRLNQIKKLKPLYPTYVQWVLTGLGGAGCAGLFFKGSWSDVIISFFQGLLVAMLGMFCKDPFFCRLYEVISGNV
jgi:hypothetical protein